MGSFDGDLAALGTRFRVQVEVTFKTALESELGFCVGIVRMVSELAEIKSRALGSFEGPTDIWIASNLQDESSRKTDSRELSEHLCPRHGALSWRQVIVEVAVVVAGVDHPQVPRELVSHAMEVSRKERMTGIEADPNIGRFQSSEQPQQVSHMAREEVG